MNGFRFVAIVGAATALLTVGCEKGQLTAPADSEIVVGAAESTLNIDPNRLQTEASTAITAQVFKDNLPQEGVIVFFQTNGGHLASCVPVDPNDLTKGCTQQGIKTDAQGAARDVLTVRIDEDDPDPIKVTAVSGAVTGTAEIKKIIGTPNRPPVPAVIIAPRDQQAVGKPVVFDGSASSDPDDDAITCYRWTLSSSDSGDKPNPYVIQGSSANAFDAIFSNVQEIGGSLQVTDDPTARTACDTGGSVVFEATAPFRYSIVRVLCEGNQAPVASIAGGDTIRVSGGFNTTINLLLDGSLSSDLEDGPNLDDYFWNCGNSFLPQEQGNGSKAVCQYRVEGVAITYTATLVVKDKGTGVFDSRTGTYECQKSSPEASVNVVVSPTAPPQ